jgi:hypothetical protein
MKLFALNQSILFYKNYHANCGAETIYGDLSKATKALRSIVEKWLPSLAPLFYTKAFREVGKHEDCIIVFDSPLTIHAANYIKKKYPQLRVIYWFWNHIYNPSFLSRLRADIEKWTYDPVDAEQYQLKLNTQFFFPELVAQTRPASKEYDCVFVGANKGRAKMIAECKRLLDKLGFNNFFLVADPSKIKQNTHLLSYEEVLSLVLSSKCVVELLPEAQKGISLRPLEALYFDKKLITNCKSIKNQPLYNKASIFILGEDDERGLGEFVREPASPMSRDVKDYYSFNEWLKRFVPC